MLHRTDEDFDVPFGDHDAVIEAEALCNGPPCSENPAEWPMWVDQDRWVPSPDPEYDTWLDRVSAIMDGQDIAGRISDDDIQDAGLPCG
jgi:hypothetical protein